ncbi:amino acid transporter [Pseudoneobacillus sp. C159]
MTEKKPFNDVIDHAQRIEGALPTNINMKQLPKPIRFLGYFFIGFFTISILLVFILNAFFK